MPKTRSEHVAINTGASVAMKLVAQLMGFVVKTVFIRTLGEQYLGVSSLFSTILSMLALAELGIGSAIAFALYKPLHDKDDRRIAALMAFYKKAYRFVAAIVAVVGLGCIPFLPMMVKSVPDITESISLIFALYIIETSGSYLFIYKSTLLTASQQRYEISKISIIFSFIRTGVQCVLLLVFKNFIMYLVVGILETLLRNYVVSKMADRRFPQLTQHTDARLEKGEVKRLFADVYALSLYRINNIILKSTDSIIIASVFERGVISVGHLGNYNAIIDTIDTFVHQFFIAILPSLGHLAADASAEKQYSVFKTLLFITFWFGCFCNTALLVLTEPFVRLLWGEKYVQPFIILFALLLDNYLGGMTRPTNLYRNSNGLFVQGKYRPVATAILNIVLSIALAQPWGIFGVLIATTISKAATMFWYDPYLVYSRVFNRSVLDYWKRYTLYALVTVASCALTYFAASAVNLGNSYLNFLVKMALCALIPNALVIVLFRKTTEYREFIIRIQAVLGTAAASIRRRVKRA